MSFLVSCGSSSPPNEDFPANALQRLKEGNDRFQKGQTLHPHITPQRVAELATTQKPFAVIISCSDSRVSPELIFDQGLGDLFVIRTAGNVLSELETGSVEYAIEHLNVETVIVMGHEDCGALKAIAENSKEEGNLAALINHLKEESELKAIEKAHPSINSLVQANIQHGVLQIKSIPGVVQKKLKQGTLTVIPAEYYLHNGRVAFLKT